MSTHSYQQPHGHTHGLLDRTILRSKAGVKAVSISLLILAAAAGAQVAIFALSSSVALLADLIHNFGDALTAVPLGIAFLLRSARGERIGGLAVVLAIFISACVCRSTRLNAARSARSAVRSCGRPTCRSNT